MLGFGGLLPNADLWTIIMFSRLPISKQTAASFRRIASGLTVTLIPFVEKTFTETPTAQQAGNSTAQGTSGTMRRNDTVPPTR
ncbi:MAG: hypothetical protein LC732_07010 [Acidobacteria bacterium]|nr:hypothetical protein [Acidobacteriota bacterium]